jgi:hypothetical protein
VEFLNPLRFDLSQNTYLSRNSVLQRIIKGKHQHQGGNYILEKARMQSFNKT